MMAQVSGLEAGEFVHVIADAHIYDRHIPLIICGAGATPRQEAKRVSNDQIAPTLTALMGVERPQCSDSEVLIIK